MAKNLSNNGIVLNQTIFPQHVSQSVDAFTGADDYDITISGSFTVTGSTSIQGDINVDGPITIYGNVVAPNLTDTAQSNVVTYNPINGQFYHTASDAIAPATSSNAISASYSSTASYAEYAVSASYASTASYVKNAQTASYVENAQTASYVETSQTASYYDETDPVFVSKSASLATTGSNTFSGSQNISGSIYQQGTFYPDIIDWFSSSIEYTTGSYILTTTTDGVTTYANYQDVATRLGDYLVTTSSFNSYTGSNTSQFAGTSSYATTASYAVSSSAADSAISASYSTTSSFAQNAISASYAVSASHADLADTASYITLAQTASYVTTAQTASYVVLAQTASYVANAQTASYVTNAQTASYVENAQTASYVLNAVSASYATTSSYVKNAQTASYVTNAQTASYVTLAQTASYVISASYATTASYSNNSTTASYALTASYLEGYISPFPFTGSAQITGSLGVTGSLSVYKSGSNVITISGSTGPLMSITDSISGPLLTVSTGSINILVVDSSLVTTITGSLNVQGGITGSLFGTASWATNSSTASYVTNAISASYSATASYVTLAQTASYVANAQTASYVNQAISASYAVTASYSLSASFATSASLAQTASYVRNSISASYAATASYVTLAQTASYYGGSVISASYAVSASYIPGKQDTLISGTNIKTINGSSILGSGNLTVNGALVGNAALFTYDFVDSPNTFYLSPSPTSSIYDITTITRFIFENNSTATGVKDWLSQITSSSLIQLGVSSTQYAIYTVTSSSTGVIGEDNIPVRNIDVTFLLGSGSISSTNSYPISFIKSDSTSSYAISSSYAQTASYVNQAVSASYATTASYAVNGGVTQLFAGPNITLSPTTGVGQVTISSTGAGTYYNTSTGSYGSFYDTTTQTNPVANVPRSMSLNTTDITNGVSISGSSSPLNTYIKITNAGVYNIQFSAQLEKTDSGTDYVDIWLRRNGVDLTDSATNVTLIGNNDRQVAAWNWFATAGAGDYYQIMWASADTGARILAEPATGVHPGIPSVIATVNRIDTFLSNTGSFSGSFTGVLNGTASYATQAATASYVVLAQTASYVTTAQTASYVLNAISSSFASTASYVNQLNQAVNISGSLNSTGSVNIYKSGSTVFVVSGSNGPLLDVTDVTSGSLFTVWTGSNRILQTNSDYTTILGGASGASALFATNKITANSGSTTLYTVPTATYDSIHVDYNIRSGSVGRVGNLFAMWSGSNVNQTETSASSFGDTSGFTFGVIVSGSNLALTGSVSTSGWTVKTIIRSI